MRLSKIKLAGFKSFVDPVSIDFTSNLTGIVGPNGCGKSNTIDAVRWVMGESSAKYLRGESMSDVIFNGSSERKPVGQASVELIFDNSETTDSPISGEFAQFNEIAIKRLVTRDGQSKYFLNGTHCRRKDITDIFLGTGLGPRSYAIIEQGMISRLIEAKPEELRTYIEEAAGISKYRQRRKETETRMQNTRDNLDRLMDLRDEVDKHLKQLDKQVKAANNYIEYRNKQRQLEAELIVFKLMSINKKIGKQEQAIAEQGHKQQSTISDLRATEKQLEDARQAWTDAQEETNQQQARYYEVSANISNIETKIKHHLELKAHVQGQLEQLQQETELQLEHYDEDKQALANLELEINNLEPEIEINQERLEAIIEQKEDAGERYDNLNQRFATLQDSLTTPERDAQIEQSRMQQLDRQIQQLTGRKQKLDQENEQLQADDNALLLDEMAAQLLTLNEDHQQAQQQLEQQQGVLNQAETEQQTLTTTLASLRSELQINEGHLASLKTLQQAALRQDNKVRSELLKRIGLDQKQQLLDVLKVDKGWELAVETALTTLPLLNAYLMDERGELNHFAQQLNDVGDDIAQQDCVLMTLDSEDIELSSPPILVGRLPKGVSALSDRIQSPAIVKSLLAHYYTCDTHEINDNQCPTLPVNALLVTKQGDMMGYNWLQLGDRSSASESLIQRKKTIEQLEEQQVDLRKNIANIEQNSLHNKELVTQVKQNSKLLQQEVNQFIQQQSQLSAKQNTLQHKTEQTQARKAQLNEDIALLREQQLELEEEHDLADEKREQALALLDDLMAEKQDLQAQRDEYKAIYQQFIDETEQLLQQEKTANLRLESLQQQQRDKQQQLSRSEQQKQTLDQRHEALLQQINVAEEDPTEGLKLELQALLVSNKDAENALTASRQQQQDLDHQVREYDKKRQQIEQQLEGIRSTLENMKLDWKETLVHQQTLNEQLSQTEFTLADIESTLPDQASEKQYQADIEQLKQKIKRLGAINLAAIDEFKLESERSAYLDTQYNDLSEALETLEQAIRKIDKETKSRFKDTFEQINERIKDMFPRLFGGGEAYLEMTSDDLLTTGVMIMARPPGKRISSIHLMSGGEKALTAATLVFAIFELNPAPFCMLDEVDAPLDEANVGRFCKLVEHMSERVQFIFITHNRATMELANNLIGVTMRELGVSRIVSVDIAAATAMAH